MTKRTSHLERGYGWFLIPGIVIFAVFIFIPFLANIVISFTRWNGVGTPKWIGLANYVKAFGDATFWASFQNNIALIFAITVIPTLVGLFLAAFLFDYVAVKIGKGWATFFRGGYYLPQVIPSVIAAVVWRWMYQPEWGVINYLLGRVGSRACSRTGWVTLQPRCFQSW